MKKLLLSLTVIIGSIALAKAQDSFSGLIKAGPGDASKLLNAYATPLFKGIGTGLNSGWNNTAKTKKLFHFDLRFSASASFISNSDKTFDVTKIGLSNHVQPADPTKTIAPTFGGEKSSDGPLLNIYDDNGRKVESFNTPAGRLSVIPAPQIQLTIGLLQNTDFTIRAIPSINLGNDVGKVSSIGFGIKHDIMQDIVGKTADDFIPFDLSLAFGYSHLNLSVPLTVIPDEGAQPASSSQSTDFSNQHIEGHFNSYLIQAIISKKLLAFTPFLAIGFNNTHTTATTVGNYPITTGGTLAGETYTTFTNPITISQTSLSGARADLGFQVNVAFFRLYASYTVAQYQSVNAGVGFGF